MFFITVVFFLFFSTNKEGQEKKNIPNKKKIFIKTSTKKTVYYYLILAEDLIKLLKPILNLVSKCEDLILINKTILPLKQEIDSWVVESIISFDEIIKIVVDLSKNQKLQSKMMNEFLNSKNIYFLNQEIKKLKLDNNRNFKTISNILKYLEDKEHSLKKENFKDFDAYWSFDLINQLNIGETKIKIGKYFLPKDIRNLLDKIDVSTAVTLLQVINFILLLELIIVDLRNVLKIYTHYRDSKLYKIFVEEEDIKNTKLILNENTIKIPQN